MHLTTTLQSEIRATLEVTFELANGLVSGDLDSRRSLADAGFSRATEASEAAFRRLEGRVDDLLPLLQKLPDLEPMAASRTINEQLTELPIMPSIVEHDGAPAHIHWTPATARFDDQVMADILMALAQEICDNGTTRFGRCDAADCEQLFYDNTRNRSRRFCADPRCASRTHTADHRQRQKKSSTRS
ncbi:MAG: CGNR zinc finger domain-containing protein [Acidimicrobiales bacterium]